MKIFISKFNDPYINQSLERELLAIKNEEDILFLWINDNAIIIGRNQNIFNEINEEFVKDKGIKISRRYSGGGAVYHDMGNILFSLITNKENNSSYEEFLKPIIGFLHSLNVNAKFHGRNDILIDDKKISGNAQYVIDQRLATHGTLLFDANLTILSKALLTNKHNIKSKGIKSNRSGVTNIKPFVKEEINSYQFLNKLAQYFEQNGKGKIHEIPDIIKNKALTLSKKIQNREWIYGKSPDAEMQNQVKFNGGTIAISFDIIQGKIQNIDIFGDFLSRKDISEVSDALNGINFNDESIKKTLKTFELSDYFGTITLEEVASVVCGK